MTLVKTVIIDDEKNSLEALENLIRTYCENLEVVAVFGDPREALDFLLRSDVDLVFLDINMPFMTGVELLKKIPNASFAAVFTTAFDQYAIDAIRLSATDYLLKPIDPTELVSAVEKVSKKVQENQEEITPRKGHYSTSRLVIHQLNNVVVMDHKDILYLKADNNYTEIYTEEKKVTASKTIKNFENQLPTPPFYRCHQSYVVNLDYMTEFSKSDQCIIMKGGKMIPLSKNKKEGLFKMLT
ncbi:LytTR family DNA-binding domain-containing protein [Saprospiraceae bacterium]|nr:LytTR family DNA-binding domain-containing protein [Saprospiraceae bacterium]